MQDELGTILGREVDMHTPAELRRYFKHVLQEAQTIYDAA
jgi:predicted nucleotidyltransferase